jgi:hypothetical protein
MFGDWDWCVRLCHTSLVCVGAARMAELFAACAAVHGGHVFFAHPGAAVTGSSFKVTTSSSNSAAALVEARLQVGQANTPFAAPSRSTLTAHPRQVW